jgi:hypothetical protein
MDETAITQYGEKFTLFAAVDPETRHLLHAAVAPSRNYLTTWRFLEELGELYGRVPPIVVTDGASYGPVFTTLGITHIVRRHSVRNRIERWIQELKRRIDTFYGSFTMLSKPPTTGYGNSRGRGMPKLTVPWQERVKISHRLVCIEAGVLPWAMRSRGRTSDSGCLWAAPLIHQRYGALWSP